MGEDIYEELSFLHWKEASDYRRLVTDYEYHGNIGRDDDIADYRKVLVIR